MRHHVQPRRQQPRFLGFLDNISQNTIFYTIIGLNASVFTMWFMAGQVYKQEGDPSNLIWMNQNFTTSWNNITSGRFWTPLTACFSHNNVAHILFNGFTFFFMASPVLSILGSRQFLFLYIGGGLVSSFTSGIWSNLAGKHDYSSHGASGAIYSIVTLLACVAPKMTFQLYGIIPVPAWLAVSGLFSYDLYSTMNGTSGQTDTVGHVGGVIAGILYFAARRFRLF
ncbi:hypothetical protein HYPSUDRAFT_140292 [Hypholoma sublateritium FD-334 SS-4]|uniref:Peptidase S54 rhomboid domain-containing protein n=1 Tax=Hypholoma sublateritium (strain FD-334 SS-4) TaxID=945553 RepID=A0A0D2PP69_HYPSF|nr:hypothetical protein HYPSUDRAFT_140292 [Hypholoma sublateritium FD-334 SS-4]